ncbi:MAG: winged helix-turn-helix domain-containing protein [Acidobacteriota bacterium]|nr:winged helix-turn-helix domain-containing protein [Acidobacteriota bacterium]
MSSLPKYKFADFTFDANEEILRKNDERLTVNPKTLRVLALLLENAGNVVKKEEFFEKVWADAFVGDNNLTVAVAQIRKTLGESKDLKFIETETKKGYRFAAPVERIFEEIRSQEIIQTPANFDSEKRRRLNLNGNFDQNYAENKFDEFAENTVNTVKKKTREPAEISKPANIAPQLSGEGFFAKFSSRKILIFAALALTGFSIQAFWRQTIAPTPIESFKSIAVLPLAAENASPEQRVFAEKLTEDLTRNLGRVTDLRVAAYDALAPLDSPDVDVLKVGKDLKIDGIVTGKITGKDENDEKTGLEIKMSDAASGAIVWEKRYALNPQNLAESQYRVASDIARELGKNKEIQNPAAAVGYEAYQTYLLARHQLGKRTTKDYEKAIENFTNAALKDTSFADAHAGLATAHVLHGQNVYAAKGLSAFGASFPAAKQSAVRALEINPNSDEALAALAFVNYRSEYDWANAETNFKRAAAINPNNVAAHRWYGEFLHVTGRFEEGFAAQKNALALQPDSARILNEIAWGNYLARHFDEAVKYVEAAQIVDKNNAAALYNASEIYEHKKDYATAAALWKEAMIVEEANRKWIASLEESFQKDGYPGFVRAKTAWLENLTEKDYVYPTDLAKGCAALGEKDKAFAWLEKAVEARIPDVLSIKYAPAFDNLRDDARFQKIVGQMNFPQ